MALSAMNYVPVLKWRQGEYQALLRLDAATAQRVMPLIEVTPPEYDFEKKKVKKTIDEQLAPFAKRLKAKWGSRPAFLDTSLLEPPARMADGRHPLTYLLDSVRLDGAMLTPVTSLGRDLAHYNAVATAVFVDGQGLAVRVSLDDISDPNFGLDLTSLLAELEVDLSETDLIIDLAAKNFDPLEDFVVLLAALLQGEPAFSLARSLVLVGTSFPASMGEVKLATQELPRLEWKLYKMLLAELPSTFRRPTFGDYTIASTDIPQGDMRLLKPSATIRYTIDDAWLIIKGNNVRDNGFAQYRAHCRSVVNSGKAAPAGYSAGSDYVRACHGNTVGTGTLTTWRWVGTNHHITRVVDDLASLHGP